MPPWGAPAHIQKFNQDVVAANPGTRLTQTTAQMSAPNANGGFCNGMTASWIKTNSQSPSMAQGSAAFGHSLNTNSQAMKNTQAQHNGRVDTLRDDLKQTQAEAQQQKQDLAQLTPLIEGVENGTIKSPKKKQQVEKWSNDLAQDMTATHAKLQQNSVRLDQAEALEAKRLGGGLPHTAMVSGKPITQDFAQQLDTATKQPGLYSLHMHPSSAGNAGHVMGMQVGKDGSCKFMDPNTGEFTMKDRKGMLNVATDHVASLYMNSNDRFSVSHFAT